MKNWDKQRGVTCLEDTELSQPVSQRNWIWNGSVKGTEIIWEAVTVNLVKDDVGLE